MAWAMMPRRASGNFLSEETLGGMRVGDEQRQVPDQIGAPPSAEPELIRVEGVVGSADHFEPEIGDDGGQ